jgi:HEPN domain-containing protein
LAFNDVHFTKTHDIRELCKEINKNDIKVNIDIESLIPLTYFAVEGRYAIIHDDLEDIDGYVETLESLLDFVKTEIQK